MKIILLLGFVLVGTGAKPHDPSSPIPEKCLKYIPDTVYMLPNKDVAHLKKHKLKPHSRRYPTPMNSCSYCMWLFLEKSIWLLQIFPIPTTSSREK